MLSVYLPPEIEARLDRAAASAGRRPADLVVDALLAHLDDLDDVRAADAALDEIREGRSGTASLDEVERELGLAS